MDLSFGKKLKIKFNHINEKETKQVFLGLTGIVKYPDVFLHILMKYCMFISSWTYRVRKRILLVKNYTCTGKLWAVYSVKIWPIHFYAFFFPEI